MTEVGPDRRATQPIESALRSHSGLDRFGRLKDARWRQTTLGSDLSRVEYGYDRVGNRTWRRNLMQYVMSTPLSAIDSLGLADWVWPWNPQASWNPADTAQLWGNAARAIPDVPGHANWILAGDRNASQQVLDAASAGWLKGLGKVPFTGGGSLGQWVYTGQLKPDENAIRAAVVDPKVRQATKCVADCIADANKQLSAGAVSLMSGAGGGAWGARDVLPFPKMCARFLGIGRGKLSGESPWTSLARLKSVAPERLGIPRANRTIWRDLADTIKRGPFDPTIKLRTGKGTQIQEIAKRGGPNALRCAVGAAAIAETTIAAYCAAKCSK